MVKVLPFPTSRLADWAKKHEGHGSDKVDGNLLKVIGSDGFERGGDPLDVRPAWSKIHVFELCGLGEVQ